MMQHKREIERLGLMLQFMQKIITIKDLKASAVSYSACLCGGIQGSIFQKSSNKIKALLKLESFLCI